MLLFTNRKTFAAVMLMVMSAELLVPATASALTSGPSQPEMEAFKPIGLDNMVDLFSGDFSYNLPLVDVGGYPLNLSYQSGASIDDEASWVGHGWTLNPGAVNRQLRGIPDDFNGSDEYTKIKSVKPQTVIGAKISGTFEGAGIPLTKPPKKPKGKKKLSLQLPTLSLMVKVDNYRGIGVDFGLNTGLSLTNAISGDKTTSGEGEKKEQGAKPINQTVNELETGITLSSFDGASAEVNFSVQQQRVSELDRKLGMSIGFPYNSRSGLSMMTLTASSDRRKANKLKEGMITKGAISFNDEPFSPNIDMPRTNNQFTFTVHAGPQANMLYGGFGISGFYSSQGLALNTVRTPAYGMLYGDMGKNKSTALMDVNREKDIPYTTEVPYLPIPVQTHDLFSASSQSGGGQYRISRGSSAVYFDPYASSKAIVASAGIEVGGPFFGQGGFDVYYQDGYTRTSKWTKKNRFLASNDYQSSAAGNLLYEPVYFKRIGESVPVDQGYLKQMGGTDAVAAMLSTNYVVKTDGGESENMFRTKASPRGIPIAAPVRRQAREVRNNTFIYLTAAEAALHGLEKKILDFDPAKLSLSGCDSSSIKALISRVGGFRKRHHISEITITADDGKRTVYGIPVYNTYQEDVTFSTNPNPSARNRGLVKYEKDVDDQIKLNRKGIDNLVNKELTPAYATNYLLTAILSPEYLDLSGNGITDDDHGDAVKFKYTRLNGLYKWRSPYAYGADTANYNEGFLSDPNDDKANYTYGEKEVWYMHSVESKTMVAYFILEDRDDGLGVLDKHGAASSQVRLKRLKQIKLFSKADIKAANGALEQVTPIKTVHFEYDYSLVPGLPNNINQGGKLTLKKVWFTYGLNNKGRLHPYEFQYSTENPGYSYRQYDRWGAWKDPAQNPDGMNNSEFPYTDQRRSNTDRYVSAGQLTSIKLPSGGTITVTYESDDYAYVQDKRAAVMAMVAGVVTPSGIGQSGLINSDEIIVDLPWPATETDIVQKCFNTSDKLYFKFLLDLDGLGHSEYVPGYARIVSVQKEGAEVDGKYSKAKIKLERNSGVNPIAAAGWQFVRLELPKYAYPGSNNIDDPDSDLKKAIKALGTAAKSFAELFTGFEKTAKRRKYSDKFNAARSWVRVGVPERKLGGGARVRKLEISDNWAALSNTPGAVTASFAQVYDYTTKDADGTIISSGVATYEPSLGGDENPFRQPIPYKEKQFLGLNTNRYIELPIGESFFPSPSVGYSKVTVRSIGAGDAESVNRTGTVVSEFYTAKDFPTKVSALPLTRTKPSAQRILSLIGIKVSDLVGLSQGYSIEVNDMHGKAKTTTILNVSGDQVSKVENIYKSENNKAASMQLSNTVKIASADNVVTDGMIGMDVELFHDSREQVTENTGVAVKFSAGVSNFFLIPVPYFFPGVAPNYEKRSYRALSTVKLIQRFGILEKVTKTENGSSITTTNLLWDGVTGNVLLTSTQNEFNDPVYSFSYPAHWEYPGMSGAYQNAGTVYQGVSVTNGLFGSSAIAATLFAGDELVNLGSADRYWVIRTKVGTGPLTTRLIDVNGALVTVSNARMKLVRPGRRNISNTAIGTLVSLRSPIVDNKINVSTASNVLDTKAFTFNEDWSMPVPSRPETKTEYACFSKDCLDKLFWSAFSSRTISSIPPQVYSPFFAVAADNLSAGSIMTLQMPYLNNFTSCMDNFYPLNPSSANANNYFLYMRRIYGGMGSLKKNDSGKLGNSTFKIMSVDTVAFKRFANQSPAPTVTQLQQLLNARLVERTSPGQGQCLFDFTVGRTVVDNSCTTIINSKPIQGPCPPGPDTVLFQILFKCPPVTTTYPCSTPVGRILNPYVAGILGNWRMQQSYAFQENRTAPRPSGPTSTNIRTGGAYNQVIPFWTYNGTTGWGPVAPSELRWIASNEMMLFNTKGMELENRDALNRYSAARFGYLESMPIAVASNAMNREIGFDGFEDLGFNLECNTTNCPIPYHLPFRNLVNGGSIALDGTIAHSGKYSLRASSSLAINTSLATVDANGQVIRPANYTINGSGQYLLNNNEIAKGFSPLPGKEYILSFWVRDNSPKSNKVNLTVLVNGVPKFDMTKVVPVVEKWKRVEARFTTGVSGNQLIQINVTGQVYIDDIRIQPYDAQMKSFVYEPRSTRLMAELDENNFSTFYEYDDEGVLIRVKKETERGIMTIKETRSSMKKTGL